MHGRKRPHERFPVNAETRTGVKAPYVGFREAAPWIEARGAIGCLAGGPFRREQGLNPGCHTAEEQAVPPLGSNRRNKIVGLTVAATLLLGLADHASGYELSFAIFYLIPVSTAAWSLGFGVGLAISVLSAVTWFVNDAAWGGHAYSHYLIPYWNAFMRLGLFAIVAFMLARLRAGAERERDAHHKLALSYAALDELRKQQLLIKDQILSNVSHELRTPLTAVHQFVMILLDGLAGELSSQQSEYLEIVRRNVEQLTNMIQDLLDATRAEAGKLSIDPSPVALDDVVTEVVQTMRSRATELGISLEHEAVDTLPPVFADDARIRQILINLIDNALKFTPSGGRVTVQTALHDAAHAKVTVSDTGKGIPPDVVEKLFERLFQGARDSVTSRQGLGLGLYICRELVTLQGGQIEVESQPGRGSQFCFTLPLLAEPVESRPERRLT
jgi:signal transduction histidine kinase